MTTNTILNNTAAVTVEENPSRENTSKIIRPRNAKDLLKSSKIIKEGDFVTIKDDNKIIEAFIVEKVEGESLTLCGIKLTEEKDDIVSYNFSAHISEVYYIGESFVRVNGALWNLRESLNLLSK